MLKIWGNFFYSSTASDKYVMSNIMLVLPAKYKYKQVLSLNFNVESPITMAQISYIA